MAATVVFNGSLAPGASTTQTIAITAARGLTVSASWTVPGITLGVQAASILYAVSIDGGTTFTEPRSTSLELLSSAGLSPKVAQSVVNLADVTSGTTHVRFVIRNLDSVFTATVNVSAVVFA